MSQINATAVRTTLQLSTNQLLAALRRTQNNMTETQTQISTGRALDRPSDDPAKVSAILSLHTALDVREQQERNQQHALSVLDATDQALSDATELVLQAKSVALSQVGVTSTADTRASEAVVVDSQIQSLLDIANRQFQGIALFGGRRSGTAGPAFEEFLGGIRYLGADANLTTDVGLSEVVGINSNGVEAFNALSVRVQGSVDLNPRATAQTRLIDVNGAQGQGARLGSIRVTVDGTALTVDLTDAETLGDVVTRVNEAIGSVDPTAGALAVAQDGFALTAATGHTVAIADLGSGPTAADLGIAISAAGATTLGSDLDPRLTEQTQLSALGTPVDFASGLKITQGGVTKVADFSSASTIQDMIQIVDQLDLGLRLEINRDGAGLNLISDVSGLELSVGENAGGTTAEDLGLRTFGLATKLSDFRHGRGVSNIQGQDDFAVELHDGRGFTVNIDGVTTVGQLIATVQAAAASSGLTVGTPGAAGTDFNVGLARDGNGLVLEDGTTGTAGFRVVQIGLSQAAEDLGIHIDAGSGSAIAGADTAQVRVESVFTHLLALRDALRNNDTRGITFAGKGIEEDSRSVVRARADVGVRAQRVRGQNERSAELKIAEQTLLSQLQDVDLAEAITRFTQQRQQLEATLQLGAINLQVSLLDFLR